MDYGEDLCDPVGSGSNSVRTRRNSSTIADSAELLEKIDKLYKLVTKNEATPIQKVNDCNCIDSSILAYEMDNVPHEAETRAKKGDDIVKECASENVLEKKPQIKVKLSQMENALNESIEAEADFQDAKKMQSHLLVKRVPLKSFQVKGENASSKKAPVIDSMGFPLASSSKNLSNPLSWESDFSSSNPFAAEVDSCVRSPVSVITSLEARSCAWCGLGESNAKNVKKLKLCSACQTTYYCSSECQSKDWSHGHSEKCQAMSR
ncbi:hypothetical protein ACHAXA_010276 [Cyclostephanos tholiformis]|uniref:MYND-type domain-containing protein n=1 Tax=Cyclostephanos tholiformis TaxID=382380 RepID=A0ABD3RDD2_9STRA